MASLALHPDVPDDLAEITDFYKSRSFDLAVRFVAAAQASLKDVARHPMFGSRKTFADPSLDGLRSWQIVGFRKYLIYYMPLNDGARVLVVAHGSRDVGWLLSRRV